MPTFPDIERLALPCVFERLIPGQLHRDGRRYLPLALLRLSDGLLLGVTDRHHVLDEILVGREGNARVVFLLSTISLQSEKQQRGLVPEQSYQGGRASTAPEAFGEVLAVPSWELRRGQLPYDSLFTELTLDVGLGVIGVRTSMTAPSIAAAVGKEPIAAGDWLRVGRSRVDILGFET